MKQKKYPYGQCECGPDTGCMECRGFGPAAFRVTRDGKRIRVCSRCDLSSDTNKILLVKPTDKADIFLEWDALGFLCIANMLAKNTNKGV